MGNDWKFLRKWSRQHRVSESSAVAGFAVFREYEAAARALKYSSNR